MISFSNRCTAKPTVMFLNVDNEAVLLNTETEFYFGLDEIGTVFWDELMNAPTVQGALETLLEKFEGVDEATLKHDMEVFITNLQERGLVVLEG